MTVEMTDIALGASIASPLVAVFIAWWTSISSAKDTAEQIGKMNRLDKVIDHINKLNGSETIVIGAQQYTRPNGEGKAEVFANAIKHNFKSKNPTTRWSDIIRLK